MLVKEKLLKIPADLWAEIEKYRDAGNFPSDQRAILNLIALGLVKGDETPPPPKQKGKRR